jgi:sugar phosphate isomerase/epimerase
VEFCRRLGPVADSVGIDIAIEPLNRKEDNLVLSVEQGARIVDEVAHPRIRLLADFYHMFEENEPVENVANAGARLRHTHLADLGRVAPGYAEGEADFVGFFRSLRRAGYDGRCSFEGRLDDLATQAKPLLDLMKQRYQESAE